MKINSETKFGPQIKVVQFVPMINGMVLTPPFLLAIFWVLFIFSDEISISLNLRGLPAMKWFPAVSYHSKKRA